MQFIGKHQSMFSFDVIDVSKRVLNIYRKERNDKEDGKIVFDISCSPAYHLFFWLFLGPRVR
jgi:hypothetical protein